MAGDDKLYITVLFDQDFAALKPFKLRLQLETELQIQIDEINLIFSMSGMQMGLNKYRLIGSGNGLWIGDITLPICTSGRSDWLADFVIKSSNQQWKAQIPFVLERVL